MPASSSTEINDCGPRVTCRLGEPMTTQRPSVRIGLLSIGLRPPTSHCRSILEENVGGRPEKWAEGVFEHPCSCKRTTCVDCAYRRVHRALRGQVLYCELRLCINVVETRGRHSRLSLASSLADPTASDQTRSCLARSAGVSARTLGRWLSPIFRLAGEQRGV